MDDRTVYLVTGNRKVPVTLEYKGRRIWLSFGYNKDLLTEIKAMKGAKWHGSDNPPVKKWSIESCPRNEWQLTFLEGLNPYRLYDEGYESILEHLKKTCQRPMRNHQYEMTAHQLKCHYVITAAEMGTGKTLATIETMERSKVKGHEVVYVGPRAGVSAVGRELIKWRSSVYPIMLTYEALTKEIDVLMAKGTIKMLILDEASKIKNPTAKRSQAALALASKIREDFGETGFVIELSGSPAPRTPADWWHLCEVACPGYIKEGDIFKFKHRLCLIEERQSVTGGVYPHMITWLDDESKCAKCGMFKSDEIHTCLEGVPMAANGHVFTASKNEVAGLYRRMKGLVLVKFKKDCLDLPEKQYRILQCKPTVEILRHAQMIKMTRGRAIQVLSKLRELSDGFQYEETKTGEETCTLCAGTGKMVAPIGASNTQAPLDYSAKPTEEMACDHCGGSGKSPTYERSAQRMVSSPKDDVLIDLLDEYEEVGRCVVWGGFTETIDKLIELCHKQGWAVLRIDGRGVNATDSLGATMDVNRCMSAMDNSHPDFKSLREEIPKLVVIGHPKAGGMAYTFHASPVAIYYSNSFDGEARIQSEDRIHRIGMDENRGCTIIDLVHLPTDMLVLNNLKKKKEMLNMSMGELETAFSDTDNVERV